MSSSNELMTLLLFWKLPYSCHYFQLHMPQQLQTLIDLLATIEKISLVVFRQMQWMYSSPLPSIGRLQRIHMPAMLNGKNEMRFPKLVEIAWRMRSRYSHFLMQFLLWLAVQER
jgi:hypothetical protein